MTAKEWTPAWKKDTTKIACRGCGTEHYIGVGRCQHCRAELTPTFAERFNLPRILALSGLFVAAWLITPYLIR